MVLGRCPEAEQLLGRTVFVDGGDVKVQRDDGSLASIGFELANGYVVYGHAVRDAMA